MENGECNRLLVMLAVHLQRDVRQRPDGSAVDSLVVLGLLRVRYIDSDTPYGDDESGFQRWLLDWWPAPPMA